MIVKGMLGDHRINNFPLFICNSTVISRENEKNKLLLLKFVKTFYYKRD